MSSMKTVRNEIWHQSMVETDLYKEDQEPTHSPQSKWFLKVHRWWWMKCICFTTMNKFTPRVWKTLWMKMDITSLKPAGITPVVKITPKMWIVLLIPEFKARRFHTCEAPDTPCVKVPVPKWRRSKRQKLLQTFPHSCCDPIWLWEPENMHQTK